MRTAARLERAELLYGRLLASAAADAEPVPARVRIAGGAAHPLPLGRWLAPVDAADRALLAHATGPVLDIGCGPGRHVAALVAAGVDALGLRTVELPALRDVDDIAAARAAADAAPHSRFAAALRSEAA